MAVRMPDGDWRLLNGNQTLSVIVYYLCRQWKEKAMITGNEYIVKTIVTSELPRLIAESFGVKSYDTLTGFKWICAKIRELEGTETFIGGGEESYGYMVGDFVRDKDAVAACAMIAEIAAWAAELNMTFFDLLVDIYRRYGFFKEAQVSVVRKGKSGAEEIEAMMRTFRENPPKELAGSRVVRIDDVQTSCSSDLLNGSTQPIEQPKSNVLQFFTEDGSKVTVRPSGTEPKIKFYFSVNAELICKEHFDQTEKELDEKIAALKRSLGI